MFCNEGTVRGKHLSLQQKALEQMLVTFYSEVMVIQEVYQFEIPLHPTSTRVTCLQILHVAFVFVKVE